MSEEKRRLLKIKILRFDPRIKGSVPKIKEYPIKEAPGMTLFIALNEIREKQEPSLQYDFVCRAGICGSCRQRGRSTTRPAIWPRGCSRASSLGTLDDPTPIV